MNAAISLPPALAEIGLLRLAVEHARDALLITEAERTFATGRRIVFVNPAFTELTGFGFEEAVGQTPDLTIGPSTDRSALAAIGAAIAEKRPVRQEILKYRKDGSTVWVEVNIAPAYDHDGRCRFFVCVMRDITETKLQRAVLEEQAARLEQASALKSQFLANISHELRTPLNAILGMTSMLSGGVYGGTTPAQRDVLRRIANNGQSLLGLIEQILDVTRIAAGRTTYTASRFCVVELVHELASALEPVASHVELVVEAPRRLALRSDRQKVKQILLNLIGNALKFTRAGRVTISVVASRRSVAISVRDTGIGIAPADQSRVFEEFWQADSSVTRDHGGAGLGLAICRSLATAIGGSLRVESVLGEGSTFALTIPIGSVRSARL